MTLRQRTENSIREELVAECERRGIRRISEADIDGIKSALLLALSRAVPVDPVVSVEVNPDDPNTIDVVLLDAFS